MKKLIIYLLSLSSISFIPVGNDQSILSSIRETIFDTTIKGLPDTTLISDSIRLKLQTDSTPSANGESEVKLEAVSNDVDFSATGKFVDGTASYYASKFEGRKTATGEIFRNSGMTAASNTFKLNTWVKVTNLKNGKTIIVRINDRMAPSMHKKGRVLDLTQTAARQLDFYKSGLAKVKVEVIKKETASR
jgi:rare lipoprotein A (peptidoglycan hydrolase)